MLKEPDPVQSQSSPELDQLQKLKYAAEVHISCSKTYLRMLWGMSQPYGSEKNTSRWRTLKEGSYYLGNAYNLVQVYKDCVPGSIYNKNIQLVSDMLVMLEFDRKHITYGYTDEPYGGETKCFVSKGQGTKYYELLHSELKKDVRSFIEMVEVYIDIPVKRFLESIKQRLQSACSEKLLEAIENDNLLAVKKYSKREVVNFKDTDGRTSLHYAVNNGNIGIIGTLLQNGAEVAQITNKGNTPLHIASSKGYRKVVEVLLQFVNHDKLNDFIDARTASSGTTSLHVAAKNGFLEVVKSLLQHGATYNIENKEGKTPINLSKNQKVANFLKLVEELFKDTKKGNIKIINKLRAVKQDEFLAVTSALNNQGNTLLQVAVANGHKNVASKLLEMLKELPPVQSQSSPECELDQLEKLKCAAELHISYSKIYLPMLRRMLQVLHPYDSEKNTSPWNTLKEGSYYLGNAYSLVQIYKDCVLGSIDNKSIQSVNDMLVTLEFDRKHITYGYTDEAYGGETKCFVSKGQGTKYYKLLHSELKKDVRSFIEMVELNIDIPVQRFLESIKQRLQSFSEKLLEAMENDNLLAVENCIKRGVVVNFKDTDGRTSLHYAVNNGNIDIVSILLKNGAEVTEITNKSNTPLHIASSKGFKEVVEVLLQYVNRDKVNGFIDAKTASDDTTSLHVAAKNGFLEVVKSLLQHGATYNIENKEGKTPINLSKNQKVANFLKLVEELFEDTKKGNVEIINKLKAVKQDEFLAVTRALNNQGNTLLQVAVSNGHKNVASKLLEMLNDPVQLQFSPECKLAQLESLKCAAELHIHFSEHCLPSLLSMSQSYGSKKNTRWKTLKKGSYYLLHAHHLVQLYNCVSGSIDNKSIQSINNVLVTLEFDPKHITRGYTDEAYGGKAECFVSKGQGTKYYELLHSELKKDVISFIGMVEIDIDSSVKMFLKSINQRLQFAFSSVKNLQDINIESEVKSLKL